MYRLLVMGQMVPLLHNDENIHDNILKWIRLRSVMDTLSSNASPKIVQHIRAKSYAHGTFGDR